MGRKKRKEWHQWLKVVQELINFELSAKIIGANIGLVRSQNTFIQQIFTEYLLKFKKVMIVNKLSMFYNNYIWYSLNLYIHYSIYARTSTGSVIIPLLNCVLKRFTNLLKETHLVLEPSFKPGKFLLLIVKNVASCKWCKSWKEVLHTFNTFSRYWGR